MKKIEIHCINARGEKGVINHFTADNTAVSDNRPEKKFGKVVAADHEARYQALKEKATAMAFRWAHTLPDWRFFVVEV